MIKLTFCLTRASHLTREQFQRYWLESHGPLVRSFAPALRIKRYVRADIHRPGPLAAVAGRGASARLLGRRPSAAISRSKEARISPFGGGGGHRGRRAASRCVR